ncbi:hypothetical protein [Actinomadura violacea]|uniref:Uncharacterized protein n=1 Tax=Actinomadura violacea TaxID=2819934 RepID=A0ABS3S7F5_9ACTN|nr:hypothetical protein [Actinomadura violacea]MBO2464936.1 hypothetical protein [Actinomadura violacea]
MADTTVRAGVADLALHQAGQPGGHPVMRPVTGAGDHPGSAVGRPGLVAIGTHGGAGVSTLVRLLDPSRSGAVVEWQTGMAAGADRVPLLVARSTAAGTMAAAGWITQWRPDLPRPVLVLVADVPFRAPPVVRYRVRALSSQVVGVVEVPYMFLLRHFDDPADALTNRKIIRAVKSVHRQLDKLSGGS